MSLGERHAAMGWAVAALAAAASLAAAWLPVPLAALAILITFLITPGALAVHALLRKDDPVPREAATLAWSPLLAGGTVVALAAAGLSFPLAVRLVTATIGFLALVRVFRPGRPGSSASPRADVATALVWTSVIAALLLGVPALALRSDGWFHAAVTLQIVERGIVPEDPYFAGLRLLYFWGEHAWAAGWRVLAPGLPIVVPLLACNIAAAFAVALAVAAFARRLGGDARAARLAVVLMVAGYAPFAWAQVLARAAWGEVRGWDEIVRLAGTGPDAALDLMGRGLLHASLVFFADKYLVVTPFAMGLALLLLTVLALLDASDQPDPRRCAVLGLTLSAVLFLHTVVGYSAVVLCAVWWAWSACRAWRGDSVARARLAPLAVTLVLVLAVASPYLLATAAGKQGQVRFGLTAGGLRSAFLAGAAIVPAALLWLWLRARKQAAGQFLLVSASVLLLVALSVRLPESNQSKFYNLLWLLLAAPAALAWRDLANRAGASRRRGLIALGVVALLPTVLFGLWAFALERGQSISTVRVPTPAEGEALGWLAAHTPPELVLCDLGGARDLLTVTGRSVLWGGPGGERDWGYPPQELAMRREAVRALCLGEDPSPRAAAWLAALARPLLVVARANAADSLSGWRPLALRPDRFVPVFQNSAMAFYRWEGGR